MRLPINFAAWRPPRKGRSVSGSARPGRHVHLPRTRCCSTRFRMGVCACRCLKDATRRLHVRLEGLDKVYQLSGEIPPVDRHGLFVCVRWTPVKIDLFLGQTLSTAGRHIHSTSAMVERRRSGDRLGFGSGYRVRVLKFSSRVLVRVLVRVRHRVRFRVLGSEIAQPWRRMRTEPDPECASRLSA